MRKSAKIFYKILILFLILEFFLGYYAFQLNNKKYGFYVPAIYKSALVVIRNVKKINSNENNKIKKNETIIDDNEKNYFVKTFNKGVIKYHPFIDVSGGPNVYTTSTGNFSVNRDYFGFRNDVSLDANKGGKKFVIIVTGGSGCVGVYHQKPTSVILAELLKKHYKTKEIIVFNLCMNSHTLSNEIQNLVHIGYNLNPSLVISHTGWNDSKYFKFNPKNFKKAGLIYYPAQVEWYDKLYDIKNKNNHRKITFEEADKEIFGNSIEKNIIKFEKIAKSFNSDLIIGIQPYDKTKAINKIDAIFLKVFEEKVEGMNIDKINFNKFSENFSFVDAGHTSQSGAYKIANIYFEHIKKNYSTKITKKISK